MTTRPIAATAPPGRAASRSPAQGPPETANIAAVGQAVFSECLQLPARYNLTDTLSGLRLGPLDPCVALGSDTAQLALFSAGGPVAVAAVRLDDRLWLHCWGPGSDALRPQLPALFGITDPAEAFRPVAGPVRALQARHPGLRLPRCPTLTTQLLRIVLGQLVTAKDAMRAWRHLVLAEGEPAPGLLHLRLPPTPATLCQLGTDRLIALGIAPRQARTIRAVAAVAARIERAGGRSRSTAVPEPRGASLRQLLAAIPGIGPWSIEYLMGSALADADATLAGDYHLPHAVSWLLAREQRGSDARMLALLEPYTGHRFRVIRLLWRARIQAPRRAPGRPMRQHIR